MGIMSIWIGPIGILVISCLFGLIFFWNVTYATLRKEWWAALYWCLQSVLLLLFFPFPLFGIVWYGEGTYFIWSFGGVLYCLLHVLGWWLKPGWYYRWDERMVKVRK